MKWVVMPQKSGLNGVQVLCKDPRVLPAGGATEMEIARQLSELARKETGLEQYAIAKFAEALEVGPTLPCKLYASSRLLSDL